MCINIFFFQKLIIISLIFANIVERMQIFERNFFEQILIPISLTKAF